MTNDEPEERRNRHQRAFASGMGAVLGGTIAGPVGAVAGAVLGPLLEPMAAKIWTELGAAGQWRTGEALAAAVNAGIPADELEDRIKATDRTQLLAGYALAAATRTAWQHKVRTLGRSLAAGLLTDDDQQMDAEQMIIAAIADIEEPHLALLNLLVCYEPMLGVEVGLIGEPLDIPAYSREISPWGRWSAGRRKWSTEDIGLARPHLQPVLASLLGTLQRHGLAIETTNTSEALERFARSLEQDTGRRLAEQRRGINRSPVPRVRDAGMLARVTWSPTELGEQVFLRFRDVGALPHASDDPPPDR